MPTSDMNGFPKKGDLDLLGVNPSGVISSQVADGGVIGGVPRGTGAVDLQNTRTSKDQVASGAYSVTLGSNNTASGSNSVCLGGNSNISSGANSTCLGGNGNTSSGLYSTVGGSASTASGDYSFAFGDNCTASGNYSFVTGQDASSFGIIGRRASSAGAFANDGDAQKSIFITRAQTSNGTATVLTSDNTAGGTNNQLILQNDQAIAFDGMIAAKQSGSTNSAAFTFQGLIYRGANAASTTLVTSSVTTVSNVPAWTVPALSADTTNGGLAITVTGVAATGIRWSGFTDTTEVIYA